MTFYIGVVILQTEVVPTNVVVTQIRNTTKTLKGKVMLTSKQIAALKYVIFRAEKPVNGGSLAKRIIAFLIDKSEGLTKDVYLTLWQDRDGFTADEIDQAAHFMGRLQSCNCTTHLDQLLHLAGTDLHFSLHYGNIDLKVEHGFDSLGIFAGVPAGLTGEKTHPLNAQTRYTFWLSKEKYSRTATQVQVTQQELGMIDLRKPGLYPDIENQKQP